MLGGKARAIEELKKHSWETARAGALHDQHSPQKAGSSVQVSEATRTDAQALFPGYLLYGR
jgi:hypothetical protein